MVLTCSRQDLHNKEGEDPTESTDMVPAKFPPKVKSENFPNFRMSELG